MTISDATGKELSRWWDLLAKKTDDWELRLVFADWLEERGEDVSAAGQRWQASRHKKPRHCGSAIVRPWAKGKRDKSWDWAGGPLDWGAECLPGELYQVVRAGAVRLYPEGFEHAARYNYAEFATLQQAETALAEALAETAGC